MDASSTRRARLTRLALCTAAVAAVAAFTGEARADNGLTTLVSGTVSGPVEQLPSPAAEPLAEVVSSVAPAVDAVPPAVGEVVAGVTQQLPGNAAGSAIAALREHGVEAGGGRSGSGADAAPGLQAGGKPAVVPPAEEPTAIAAETATVPTASIPTRAAEASRPSSGFAPRARTAAPPPRPSVEASHVTFSGQGAPSGSATTLAAGDLRSDHASQPPSSPLPSSSELPGFDALLPPLAAFALLLALPLGFFALTAPSALGAGVHPAVASLRSADVRFRLVRPG